MFTTLLLLLAALPGNTMDAAAIEIPLEFMKRPERMTSYLPTGILYPERLDRLPDGAWKLPELKSDSPIYSPVRLGDEDLLFILDRKEKVDPLFNRIYFDANGNHDLTDDPMIDGSIRKVSGSGSTAYFADYPVVDTRIRVDGKEIPYSFQVRMYYRRLPGIAGDGENDALTRALTFYITNNCVYTGTFDYNGSTFRITLGDNNANGRFGDRYRPPDPSNPRYRNDTIFITTEEKVAYQDGLEVGDYLYLENRLFHVRFHINEDKMTLTPKTGKLHDLHLSMAPGRAMLAGGTGEGGLMLVRPGKKIAVPEGRYRLVSYQAFREDDGGNLWRLKALGRTDGPQVHVSAGEPSLFHLGEPFRPSVKVTPFIEEGEEREPDPTKARLSLEVLGTAGERLTDLRTLTNNESGIPRSEIKTYLPKEALYRILGPNDKVAAEGAFKYG